jgi:hypothetical protein
MTPWTIGLAAPGALLFLLFPVHHPALARAINRRNSTNSKGQDALREVHHTQPDVQRVRPAGTIL